jgi:hypothetical protein
MRDADDLQVGWVDFHADLFSTFADRCLCDGLAALKMSPSQTIVPVFEPGVGSSEQEYRAGAQQEGVDSNG